NIQYESIWSLIIFAVGFFILGFVVDLFFGSMGNATAEKLTGNVNKIVVKSLLGFVTNWVTLVAVDALMNSVNLTLESYLIIAILVTLLESVFNDKEKRNESRK